jgi:hypothetical protein
VDISCHLQYGKLPQEVSLFQVHCAAYVTVSTSRELCSTYFVA